MNKIALMVASSVIAVCCIAVARAQAVDSGGSSPMLFLRGGSAPSGEPPASSGSLPSTLPPPALPPSLAPQDQAKSTLDTSSARQQIVRLSDLGHPDGLLLRGPIGESGVAFTVRQDDAFIAARINVAVSVSPAIAREEGELVIFLNDERVAAMPIGRSKGARARADFTLNPALLASDNRLRFSYVGKSRAADACKAPRDGALWVRVEPASFVFLSSTRLPIADDLAILPRPFVDSHDPLAATVPFVLPPSADAATMQAATTVASWLGVASGDKDIRLPVSFATLPAANAVVFVVGNDYPQGVAPVSGSGPRVALTTNPARLETKLLIIVGDDTAQLQTAAATLALDPSRFSGGTAEAQDILPPARQPYDAPRWLATDKPVRLGDLVAAKALSGRSVEDGVTIPFRTAPDLYFGSRVGGMLNLRLRRESDSWIDAADSRVKIDLNGKEIDEAPIETRLKVLSRLREYLFPGTADDRVAKTLLPAGQLQGANQLAFRFDLRARQGTDCSALDWSSSTGVDPDSTIDLGRASHFAMVPNLALFAGSGFPFTKLADLSDTAFIVSDSPAAEELQAVFELMAFFARETGLPATRQVVTTASHPEGATDRNVIAIGVPASHPLLRKWEPLGQLALDAKTLLLGRLSRLLQPFGGATVGAAPDIDGARGFLKANADRPSSWMATFDSPLDARQVAVVIGASDAALLPEMARRFADPRKRNAIRGDLFLASGEQAESYTSGRQRFAGTLPPWHRLQWLAQSLGLVVFAAMLGAVLLFSFAVRRLAMDRARMVLARGDRLPSVFSKGSSR